MPVLDTENVIPTPLEYSESCMSRMGWIAVSSNRLHPLVRPVSLALTNVMSEQHLDDKVIVHSGAIAFLFETLLGRFAVE